ncbi:MAG: tRNA lysidine(34) synthetase TilS [Rhodothalassiaceae bacterium]
MWSRLTLNAEDPAQAVTSALAACLAAHRGPYAVAVSGGPDSMALAWAARRADPTIRAVHVNHRLRQGTDAEAGMVAGWLKQLGYTDPTVLLWESAAAGGDLQARARHARYGLMEAWCRDQGIRGLLLAHHREDQAETLLIRLARGSGVDGLAAMAPAAPPLSGGPWPQRLRPLLTISRATLRQLVGSAGLPTLDDPSNRDRRFARAQARALLDTPPLPGLSAERLAATADRFADALEVLDAAADHLADMCVSWTPLNSARLGLEPWRAAPADTRHRLLARLLCLVAGRPYRPRYRDLQRVADALADEPVAAQTLHHTCVIPGPPGQVDLVREAAGLPGAQTLRPGAVIDWDGRYRLWVGALPLTVKPLGEAGWRQIKQQVARDPVPHVARLVIPAGWQNETVIAVPQLGLGEALLGVKALRTVIG